MRLQFLNAVFQKHGDSTWHIPAESAAKRFLIAEQEGYSGARRLVSEMRYYLFTQYKCDDNACSIAIDVIIFCICTICVCRQRVFDGVTLFECVGPTPAGKDLTF